jgi:hypothetical protein
VPYCLTNGDTRPYGRSMSPWGIRELCFHSHRVSHTTKLGHEPSFQAPSSRTASRTLRAISALVSGRRHEHRCVVVVNFMGGEEWDSHREQHSPRADIFETQDFSPELFKVIYMCI